MHTLAKALSSQPDEERMAARKKLDELKAKDEYTGVLNTLLTSEAWVSMTSRETSCAQQQDFIAAFIAEVDKCNNMVYTETDQESLVSAANQALKACAAKSDTKLTKKLISVVEAIRARAETTASGVRISLQNLLLHFAKGPEGDGLSANVEGKRMIVTAKDMRTKSCLVFVDVFKQRQPSLQSEEALNQLNKEIDGWSSAINSTIELMELVFKAKSMDIKDIQGALEMLANMKGMLAKMDPKPDLLEAWRNYEESFELKSGGLQLYKANLERFRQDVRNMADGLMKLKETIFEGKSTIADSVANLQVSEHAIKQTISWSDVEKHDSGCVEFAVGPFLDTCSMGHMVYEVSQCMPADYQPNHKLNTALAAMQNKDESKPKLVWLLGDFLATPAKSWGCSMF